MARRVTARVGPVISYCPLGLGKLGKRIIETEAVCTRCGNMSWAHGAEVKSRIVALVMLKLTCPRREANFYVEAYPMPKMRKLAASRMP